MDYAASHRTASWRPGSSARFWSAYASVMGFRAHAGRPTPGQGGIPGESRDAAKVDDQGGLVASALAAGEDGACVAGAQSQFRRVGDAGQLSVPMAGGARPGLPVDRPDR